MALTEVNSLGIKDAEVKTADIAADAVTGAKIADDQIDSEHYVDGSIDTAHIADANVTLAKVENVTDGEIIVGNGSNRPTAVAVSGDVTMSNAGAVTIATGAVEHAMLAADAVDGDNIADDSVNSEHYVDGSIDTAHIADDQVTQAKIADNAVGLDQLAGIARGKLIYGDSSGNPAVLSVGSANQVLTADGTDFAWAAAAASGMPGTPYFSFSCNDASITLTNQSTWYDCKPNNPSSAGQGVVFDSASAWSNTTGRFTPQTAGTYFVWGGVGGWEQGGAACNRTFHILKNGSSGSGDLIGITRSENSAGPHPSEFTAGLIALNGSSDYVVCQVYQTGHQYGGSISCFNFGALRLF